MIAKCDLTRRKEAVSARGVDACSFASDCRAGRGADRAGFSTAECYGHLHRVSVIGERIAESGERVPDQGHLGGILRVHPSFHLGERDYAGVRVLQSNAKH